jgi:hypothetical protein
MAAVPCTVPQHVSRAGLFPGYRITLRVDVRRRRAREAASERSRHT